MSKDQSVSAGLSFMQAAAVALASVGDKERVLGMRDALQFTIHHRLPFAHGDAPALSALSIESRVGDFRPLDYYKEACLRACPYAEMWESHQAMAPWIARWAVASQLAIRDYFILENNRVSVGMGVLLPEEVDPFPDSSTLPVSGKQVWWVMAMSADFIRVCRYRLTAEELANRHRDTPFLHHSRTPFRVRVMTREEWTELNIEHSKELQAA